MKSPDKADMERMAYVLKAQKRFAEAEKYYRQALVQREKRLGADKLEPEQRGYPRLTAKYGKQVNGVMESRFEKTNSA